MEVLLEAPFHRGKKCHGSCARIFLEQSPVDLRRYGLLHVLSQTALVQTQGEAFDD